MSNLHVNLDEANKHTPKGFDNAVNNTRPWKDEQAQSTYTENFQLPRAINFVDGTVAPPTTADLDVYVLTGAGSVDAGWGTANFGDWVRFLNGIAAPITPLAGALCYDDTAASWKEFDGSVWAVFGGGGSDTNLGTDNLTLSGAVTRTYNIDGNELKFIDGANNKIKIAPSGIGIGNLGVPAAQLEIKGAGTTSGTMALLVQNNIGGAGGTFLKVDDSGSFGLGRNTSYTDFQNVTVGNAVTATGSKSICIGDNSTSTQTDTISIGQTALVTASNGIGIGSSVNINTGTDSIGMGRIVNITGSRGIGIGLQTTVSGGEGIAIQRQSTASGSAAIAIGYFASGTQTSSLGLGKRMQSTAAYSIMIGGSASTNRINSTANSVEFNFNEATSTIRLAKSADSWINTANNFGIGTNTPSAKLDVNGSTFLNGNLGVFGTTPIAQPTTAIIAPAPVAVGGVNVQTNDTFEGYTLSQVVKALRNLGILA